MNDYSVLQGGRARRRAAERRARRRRRRLFAGLGATVLLVALLLLAAGKTTSPKRSPAAAASAQANHAPRAATEQTPVAVEPPSPPVYGAAPAPAAEQIHTRQTFHLTSGILFDVTTGQVLWQHNPGQRLPIASLTKLMTALVVADKSRPSDRVLVTRAAVDFSGSGIGLLPLHKMVSELTLLYGLLLPSGNDAAIALAQHVAGSEQRFVALMNERARAMHLTCSHFASASGLIDQNNYSCTSDLAQLAHAMLEQPLLGKIVGSRSAVMPLPIKAGKVYLYNNNPLLLSRYPGADGVKTGYTFAAGRCLVATAKRGSKWLGVVLLHSVDPPGQAEKLLDAGFAALNR